jgi:hypothetical protein
MTNFTKQQCSVYEQTIDKGVTKVGITKKSGYMCKGLLHLIKEGTNSWKLSHELTGFLITNLYMSFNDAKKATVLISTLIDWNTPDKELINERIHNLEGPISMRDIISASTEELETIRLEMLGAATTLENIVTLSYTDV